MQRKTAVQCSAVRTRHTQARLKTGRGHCVVVVVGGRSVRRQPQSPLFKFCLPPVRRVGSIIRSRSSALTSTRATINQAGRRTELRWLLSVWRIIIIKRMEEEVELILASS